MLNHLHFTAPAAISLWDLHHCFVFLLIGFSLFGFFCVGLRSRLLKITYTSLFKTLYILSPSGFLYRVRVHIKIHFVVHTFSKFSWLFSRWKTIWVWSMWSSIFPGNPFGRPSSNTFAKEHHTVQYLWNAIHQLWEPLGTYKSAHLQAAACIGMWRMWQRVRLCQWAETSSTYAYRFGQCLMKQGFFFSWQ